MGRYCIGSKYPDCVISMTSLQNKEVPSRYTGPPTPMRRTDLRTRHLTLCNVASRADTGFHCAVLISSSLSSTSPQYRSLAPKQITTKAYAYRRYKWPYAQF
ncbi:predicted protein [Sclerotinia sclerotiorum 1980 UF-70]|uniref:Uncharacterized protein n=1 Tax=Sclerotinia sclerotiorum (strain ATCC 18683 / 1980 / Ss-1) TaxID=665079 RepID=A7E6C8_SCLS1|nr:predicted protein [Sclerotinia sclerotiorum 1980 UF-70]EDN91450.1 predicted protein [Sclerotinia sclerotiorum 1980 UF-70]